MNGSLAELLQAALPTEHNYKIRHVATPPTRCASLFAPPPGRRGQRTFRESHLLTVSASVRSAAGLAELRRSDLTGVRELAEEEGLCTFVFALEVFVYQTRTLTTVFVAKADSTGFHVYDPARAEGAEAGEAGSGGPRARPGQVYQAISTVFIDYLVRRRRREGVPVLISLFARAQNQYLFPGSVEFGAKRVATGQQLVRWWCRVLTAVVERQREEGKAGAGLGGPAGSGSGNRSANAEAYLVLPGEPAIRPFLPRSILSSTAAAGWQWRQGHPFRQIGPYRSGPARSRIPYFPDDPKSRFFDHLDEDLADGGAAGPGPGLGAKRADGANGVPAHEREKGPRQVLKGVWPSVRTVEQFFEFIAYRQECALGSLTGFFYVVIPAAGDGAGRGGGVSAGTAGCCADKSQPRPAHSNRQAEEPAGKGARRGRLRGRTFDPTLFDSSGRLIPIVPRRQRPLDRTKVPPGRTSWFIWDRPLTLPLPQPQQPCPTPADGRKSQSRAGTERYQGGGIGGGRDACRDAAATPTAFLTDGQYSQVVQLLLRTDHSRLDAAVAGSRAWIGEVNAMLSSASSPSAPADWEMAVTGTNGRFGEPEAGGPDGPGSEPAAAVPMLVVRKKKRDGGAATAAAAVAAGPGVGVLPVRRKVKP